MIIDFTKSNRDYKTLKPIAQQAYLLFMEECNKNGIKIFPTDFLRTTERQYYLICQGRTAQQSIAMGVKSDFANKYANPKATVVTYTLQSNHRSGMAWDIACSPPQALYDSNVLKKAGEVAKKLGIRWGGSCFGTFIDSPHFEIDNKWKAPKEEYKVEKTKININGKLVEVDTINIDGNNYVKLRSLESDKITIGYDNAKKIPTVTTK